MARNPDHPQAAHLYIHLMENGPDPKRAEAAADRLATPLAPAAGHLVHMPAHIYYRLGRWKDSMRVNVDAARADEAYIRASSDRGLVRYGYYPHNVHFIVTSAQMAGDLAPPSARRGGSARSLDPSRELEDRLDPGDPRGALFRRRAIRRARRHPGDARARRAAALCRGRCAIMPAPSPAPTSATATASTHEIGQLRRVRETGDFKPMVDQGVPAPDLLLLAETVARGRLAFMPGPLCRGRRALQAGDRDRGQAALHGAALLVLSGAPVARRGAVSRRPL